MAVILTENGHAEDIKVDFRQLKISNGKAMEENIYNLKLHQRIWIANPAGGKDVYRVPGGWIYSDWDSEKDIAYNSVFVPFDKNY